MHEVSYFTRIKDGVSRRYLLTTGEAKATRKYLEFGWSVNKCAEHFSVTFDAGTRVSFTSMIFDKGVTPLGGEETLG